MKETDLNSLPIQENIQEERQEIKQLELKGDLIVPRGHTVYFVDLPTLIVRRLKYKEESTLDMTRGEVGAIVKGKIEHNDNHIVFTSLNDKNALRKVKLHVSELGVNPALVKFEK